MLELAANKSFHGVYGRARAEWNDYFDQSLAKNEFMWTISKA